jgi:hypothetical protein
MIDVGARSGRMSNSDEISQAERRRMIEERRLKTYHGHAMSAVDDERGGRYAIEDNKQTVIGSSPIVYPAQPAGSPWASDPVGLEPPLGYSIEAQETTGEPHEIAASMASQEQVPVADVARKFPRRF